MGKKETAPVVMRCQDSGQFDATTFDCRHHLRKVSQKKKGERGKVKRCNRRRKRVKDVRTPLQDVQTEGMQ